MRFIAEYKTTAAHSHIITQNYKDAKTKKVLESQLGEAISKSFGWDNPNNNPLHGQLEIEAFPMDKWVEFKQKLYELFHKNGLILSGGVLEHMLRDLESFGKPSGDAITNQQLNK